MIELRAFQPADDDELMSWFGDEEGLRNWAGPSVVWPLDRAQLDRRRDEPGLQAWSAYLPASDGPVGHIELLRMGPELAQIDRVAIAPAHRGQGLSADLLRAALAHARDGGFLAAELIVFADNLPAVRTYLTVGFTDVGPISPDSPSVRRMLLTLGN